MQSDNQKLVLVSGLFNILHPGHFRLLQFARSQGHRLLVALQTAPTSHDSLTIDVNERLRNVRSISYVDHAFILEGSLRDCISEHKPDIVVKGWEFVDKQNPERELLDAYGGKLIFCPDQSTHVSFSKFANQPNSPFSAIKLSTNFVKRRGIDNEKIVKTIQQFSEIEVCVIGDLIVDEYINCAAVGMSREDPTLVVKPENSALFIGGAGIVARHAQELGANVNFISVTGDDQMRHYCIKQFTKAGLTSRLFVDDTRSTTKKTRYRTSGKTMLRVNDFNSHSISKDIQQSILNEFKRVCHNVDLLVLSDFNYGVLPPQLAVSLIQNASENGIPIVADSQTSSQVGNLAKFVGVSLVTPTEHEIRLTLNDFESGLVALSNKLRQMLKVKNVVVTLAQHGVLITSSDGVELEDGFENDRLPAFQASPIDVSGAGDAFMVTSALALAARESIWTASYIGAMSSAIQVSREGNIPISPDELKSILNQ